MEKEIDYLLKVLSNEFYGALLSSLIYENKIDRKAIERAEMLDYVWFFKEGERERMHIFHEDYYCRLTPKGTEMLIVNNGINELIRRNKRTNNILFWTLVLAGMSFVVSLIELCK